MAKVLFFVQWIVALVVLPLWPGVDPHYALLGAWYLLLIVVLPSAAVTAVFGLRAAGGALADAWSPAPQPGRAPQSVAALVLASRTFPLAGFVSWLAVTAAAFNSLRAEGSPMTQALVLGVFCLVWGFLGLLLGRILVQVVESLSERRSGLVVLSPAIGTHFGLTPRETETAQAVLDGLTYKDAAEKLNISPSTAKSHVLSVYQKTGTGNKIELLRLVEAETVRIHPSVHGPATKEPGF